jgi:hypothetical protein
VKLRRFHPGASRLCSARLRGGGTPSDVIVDRLAVYLGADTARTTVVTFCRAAFAMPPAAVTRSDVPRVLAALRPMLNTLIGDEQSDEVLARIADDLR